MARWRRAVELAMKDEDLERLMVISRSRTEAASRVERAQMLLTYRENPSLFAGGQRLGVHHQTVQRCVERAVAYGPLAALDDRPRPGKEPTITPEAKAWLVSVACDKAKEHGYASFARDYEYKRHGTLSLLAGIDLLTGKVHALVRDVTAAESSSNSSSFSTPPIRLAPRSS
jgi:hypothetical protein